MSSSINKPRLVIYGTGQYGLLMTRLAVKNGWPIVAAFNRAGAKVGQDLGRLAGLDHDLGVIVQDCDLADYSHLDADIAVVTTTNSLRVNLDGYKRLMKAGLNIACHAVQSYYPYGSDPALAAEIDELAKAHGVTFTGGGIWDMSRIWAGILAAGPCTELKSLFHSSWTNLQGEANARDAVMLGASLSLEDFTKRELHKSPIGATFKTIQEHVLTALGYTVTTSTYRIEPIVLDAPIESILGKDGMLEAGLCAGMRIITETQTKEGVTGHGEFAQRLFRPGDVEHMFWSVDGLPRTSVRTERKDTFHATAACLFNRIPDIIAAPSGIRLVSQMGPLKHSSLYAQAMKTA